MVYDEELATRIGRALREIRQDAGLSIREAEIATGINRGSLSRFESGRHSPALCTVIHITAAYGKSVFTLLRKAGVK